MNEPEEITVLLKRAGEGDPEAANALFHLVESDLRKIAGRRKQSLQQGIDAPTTLLIDEAYFRAIGQQSPQWDQGGRRHFYAYVAKTIEWLLLDMIKAQTRQKRQGDHQKAEGWDLEGTPGSLREDPDLMLDLQSKLDQFEHFAPEDAMVFRFRFFLGCTFEEIAQILEISETAAKRRFHQTRLWLQKELKDYHNES